MRAKKCNFNVPYSDGNSINYEIMCATLYKRYDTWTCARPFGCRIQTSLSVCDWCEREEKVLILIETINHKQPRCTLYFFIIRLC